MQNIPQKFLNPETGELNTQSLLNSYLELEKKLSTMMPKPEDEEGKLNLLKTLGLPETPEEYEVDTSHGLFDVDPELNSTLHAKGFTADQVQTVYDLAAEKLVPLIMEMSAEFNAEREVEKLINHFGGEEKWQEVSRQILNFAEQNLPEEILSNLSNSYDGVIALYKMMKSEQPEISPENAVTSELDEKQVRTMMRDPRYWKKKDPSYIEKVSNAFEKLYGNK